MAKKKKRQTAQFKSSFIMVIVLVIAALIIGAPVWQEVYQRAKGYVIKVNGSKVTSAEYKFYIAQEASYYEQLKVYFGSDIWSQSFDGNITVGESVIDNAVSTAISNKICFQQAQKLGLALTDEDHATVADNFAYVKENFDKATLKYIGASDSKLKKILEQGVMVTKLYEYITKDFVVNEPDFDVYLEDYLAENYDLLHPVEVNYALFDTLEGAEAFITALEGADFSEIALEHKSDIDLRETVEPATLTADAFPEEVFAAGKELAVGDTSEPIVAYDADGNEEYYVLNIISIGEPDIETVSAEQRETYINEQKGEIFQTAYAEWYGALDEDKDIIFNQTLLKLISIRGATFNEIPQEENADDATDVPEN